MATFISGIDYITHTLTIKSPLAGGMFGVLAGLVVWSHTKPSPH